jgi:AcrR family transcriptional regulator
MRGDDPIQQRIIAAADGLLVEGGPEALGAARVCAAAHVDRTAFDRRFPDEAALIGALLRRYLDEEEWACDSAFGRARDLSDEPLRVLTAALSLLAQDVAARGRAHPLALVALCRTSALSRHPRLGTDAREAAARRRRARFRAAFQDVADRRPGATIGADDFAELASALLEGPLDPGSESPSETICRRLGLLQRLLRLAFGGSGGEGSG